MSVARAAGAAAAAASLLAAGWTAAASDAAAGEVVDLAVTAPDVTVYGTWEPFPVGPDRIGKALAAGDFNGDGCADLALAYVGGGPDETAAGTSEIALLFCPLAATVDLASGADTFIYEDVPSDLFGVPTVGADLNRDGFDDLVMGARIADGPLGSRLNAGQIVVLFGRASFPPILDLSQTPAAVRIHGRDVNDTLGQSLAIGDVNGDGWPDIVAGADDAAGPGNTRPLGGEVYLIWGGPSWPAELDLQSAPSSYTVIYGIDAGDSFGEAVAVGDANGDSIDDVLIGADLGQSVGNARSRAGEAHLLFGRSPWPASLDLAAAGSDRAFLGADDFDRCGGSLALCDVDGDGRDDVILAASDSAGYLNAGTSVGEVYVLLDPAAQPATIDLAAGGSAMTIYGADDMDTLGAADTVRCADVDGDAYLDLVLGAGGGDGPGNTRDLAGEAYLVRGRASGFSDLILSSTGPDMIVYGIDPDDIAGSAVLAHDLSASGFTDIVIGASRAAGPANSRPRAGEVYVVRGGAPLLRNQDVTALVPRPDLSVIFPLDNDLYLERFAPGGEDPDASVIGRAANPLVLYGVGFANNSLRLAKSGTGGLRVWYGK